MSIAFQARHYFLLGFNTLFSYSTLDISLGKSTASIATFTRSTMGMSLTSLEQLLQCSYNKICAGISKFIMLSKVFCVS